MKGLKKQKMILFLFLIFAFSVVLAFESQYVENSESKGFVISEEKVTVNFLNGGNPGNGDNPGNGGTPGNGDNPGNGNNPGNGDNPGNGNGQGQGPAATASNTPGPAATASNTPGPAATASNTPGPAATASNTPGPAATASNTPGPAATATNTPGPAATATNNATGTKLEEAKKIADELKSDKPYSLDEIAELFDVHIPQIKTLIDKGELEPINPKNRFQVYGSEIQNKIKKIAELF